MADYSQKLSNMRNRRLNVGGDTLLTKSAQFSEIAALTESYEQRGKSEAVKYALGAMQQLEPKATRISLEEADRVKNQLSAGLNAVDIPATYELQGSVPLNIHVRFSSDVDMLVLHNGFITFAPSGIKAGLYTYVPGTPLSYIQNLRANCEAILVTKFPAANVDKSGAKSISLSGGSLRRKVDVVPCHWHDTTTYQQTQAKHDREVRVLDKHTSEFITNRPFLHMKSVEEKDQQTVGGAKKVIRLLKNLKRDSEKNIKLTSYDIASLAWNMDAITLIKPYYLELSLIADTQQFLQTLINNPDYARGLDTPDKSRKIIDSQEKFESVSLLKTELDKLAWDISNELRPFNIKNNETILKSLRESAFY